MKRTRQAAPRLWRGIEPMKMRRQSHDRFAAAMKNRRLRLADITRYLVIRMKEAAYAEAA